MLTTLDIVLFSVGGFFLLVWLFFYIKGYKKASFFEPLTEKEYPLKEIYFVGLEIMDTIKYKYKSAADRRLRREVEVIYDRKYADYYLRVIYAQKVTVSFTVFVLAFAIYGLADSIAGFVVMLVFAGLAYYYFGTLTSERIKKRSEEMLNDFSEVISKLALLTNAGMIFREAWEEVAGTGDRVIYKEMQKSIEEMNNGVSEVDAVFNFGSRCIIPEIKKFSSTIIQGLIKGNSELTSMLQQQSSEVWNLKKQRVKREGEKAASKLMIPIMMMFVGILIMILIPIFTNLGV